MQTVFDCSVANQTECLPRTHIVQYHEVIGGLVGPWGERAALFFNVVSLVGLAVVQIIACASDAYYLYDGMNKRYFHILRPCLSLDTSQHPDSHSSTTPCNVRS